MKNKKYLGDSVYAQMESGRLLLTTENDESGPSNKIYLEHEVIVALLDYLKLDVKARTQASNAQEGSEAD